MSIIVKIRKENDIRRITIPQGTPFLELHKLSSQLFNLQTPFVLKYRDDENDLITISNDIELQESLQFLKEGRPFNLEVHNASPSQPQTQPSDPFNNNDGLKFFENLVQQYQPLVNDFLQQFQSQAASNTQANANDNSASNNNAEQVPIHNAYCDSCQEQIVGWRFKCQSCPDFDLCQLCIGKNDAHGPSHQFTTIEKPERTFAGPWEGHCRRFFHPYTTQGCH